MGGRLNANMFPDEVADLLNNDVDPDDDCGAPVAGNMEPQCMFNDTADLDDDFDGIYDHWDIDDDNDGIWDYMEVDSRTMISMTTLTPNHRAPSSLVQTVRTTMMMEQTLIQMMMDGIKRYGIRDCWDRGCWLQSTMTWTMTTMEFLMVRTPMTITTESPIRYRRPWRMLHWRRAESVGP